MRAPSSVQWHRHGWNTDLSWRLILGIIPRVPAFLRPPLHLVTTLVCFAAMRSERRAARRNLGRVLGRRGPASLITTFRLFYNFSKFMVAYVEVPPWGGGISAERINGGDKADRLLRECLKDGRGLIAMGMHLGQWDLALLDLARRGIPITVVMRREDEDAARWPAAARAAAGIRVAYAGENPWMSVELLAALRRNEIVAVQGDRAYGGRNLRATFFGEAGEIPSGPWELACASGAPILPAAVVFNGHRRYRHVLRDPIRPADAGDSARIAAAMESLIREYPTQWFNFYDVWPAAPRGGDPDLESR